MQAIVVVDRNWGIGCEGGLLFHLPGDLKHFKRLTLGKAVVMGRRTLQSLPGGRPLPGRDNIVLSRDPGFQAEGVTVVRNLEELDQALEPYAPENIMICGGQQIYELLIDRCSTAYVTMVEADAPADSHFPRLDQRPGWRLAEASQPQQENGLTYRFCTWVQDKA